MIEKKAETKATIKPITDRNMEEKITLTSARPRKGKLSERQLENVELSKSLQNTSNARYDYLNLFIPQMKGIGPLGVIGMDVNVAEKTQDSGYAAMKEETGLEIVFQHDLALNQF